MKELESLFLPCETCGRDLDSHVLDCPERQHKTCPFTMIQKRGQRSMIWLVPVCIGVAMMLLVVGMALFWESVVQFIIRLDINDVESVLPVLAQIWYLFLLPGAAIVFIGFLRGVRQFTDTVRIYNRKTGQLWEQTRAFDMPLSQVIVSTWKPVKSETPHSSPLEFPASLSIFVTRCIGGDGEKKWKNLTTEVCYLTLLNLLNQGVITLYYAGVVEWSRWFLDVRWWRKNKVKPVLMFAPTPQSQAVIEGDLEQKLFHMVSQLWQQRREWFLHIESRDPLLSDYFWLVEHYVCDLMCGVFDGKTFVSVEDRLIDDILEPDASRRGISRQILEGTHALSPEQKAVVEATYHMLLHVAHAFSVSYPDIETQLQKDILWGIECSTAS